MVSPKQVRYRDSGKSALMNERPRECASNRLLQSGMIFPQNSPRFLPVVTRNPTWVM